VFYTSPPVGGRPGGANKRDRQIISPFEASLCCLEWISSG
jgi:hypothetical protein